MQAIPEEPLQVPLPLPDATELVRAPGRAKRPKRIAIVLRGPPGSGKSHLARLLRDAEVAAGGEAPRIHSIDDYFITVSAAPLTGCSCHSCAQARAPPLLLTVLSHLPRCA